MKKILLLGVCMLCLTVNAQKPTFKNHYTRSFSDVMSNISSRFGVRFKYNVDTTGLKLAYADFRIRPYSVDETLENVLLPFDFKPVKQDGNVYKIKPYEYPRRTPADGKKLI